MSEHRDPCWWMLGENKFVCVKNNPVLRLFQNFGWVGGGRVQGEKSSQHVRAWATQDGAFFSKNRKILLQHRDSPNTRNGALTVSFSNYDSCYLMLLLLQRQ